MSNFFKRIAEVEQNLPAYEAQNLFENWCVKQGECTLADVFFKKAKNGKEMLCIHLTNSEFKKEFSLFLPSEYEDQASKASQFKLAKVKFMLQKICCDKEKKGSMQQLFTHSRKIIGSVYNYQIKENFWNERVYQEIVSLDMTHLGKEHSNSLEWKMPETQQEDLPF